MVEWRDYRGWRSRAPSTTSPQNDALLHLLRFGHARYVEREHEHWDGNQHLAPEHF